MADKPSDEKLKILAAGDIHGDISLAEKLAAKAKKENVDLVILCGDITNFDSSTENLIRPFVERKEKLLIVPGNHESEATADFLAEFYDIKNIHGKAVRYKQVGIFGGGGANIGLFQFDEDEIYELLKKSFKKIDYLKKKIMVTHVHPTGTKMERFTTFFKGSEGIRRAVDRLKPDLLLCSHVHEAEGIEEIVGSTRVINVGKRGKIIEL